MRPSVPVFLALMFIASAATAQSPPAVPPDQAVAAPARAAADNGTSAPQAQRQGAITFVSGGAGEEDRNALRQVEAGYNLRLLFAQQGSGAYLADVGVSLVDAQGKTVLDTIADGPILFAHVPPGRYKLKVVHDGKSQARNIAVAASGAVSQDFYWPQST